MNLGSYRLIVHLGPGKSGDWYQAQDDRGAGFVRVLVCWDEAPVHDAWQAMARRLRLFGAIAARTVIPLVHLALDDEHPHAVWATPPDVSLKDELRGQIKWTEKAILEIGQTLCEVLASYIAWSRAWPVGAVRNLFRRPARPASISRTRSDCTNSACPPWFRNTVRRATASAATIGAPTRRPISSVSESSSFKCFMPTTPSAHAKHHRPANGMR